MIKTLKQCDQWQSDVELQLTKVRSKKEDLTKRELFLLGTLKEVEAVRKGLKKA